jgi:DNA repair exonuclease SbcCD ATPase subunit
VRVVNFKKLTIKNFLSVGQTPVTINFEPGISVITGINYDKEDSKNGVGKSTIIDALYFALFGTTIRELNKDLIVNSITKDKCEVELDLQLTTSQGTNTFNIKRTLQPTKCFITKDGVDVTRSTLPKTNEFIQTLINSSGPVFQNSVIMTINNTVPFMAQSKVEKRKFIESVLNLEVFSKMLLRARDEYNELKRSYDIIYAKKETLEKQYNLNNQQLELFETNKRNKIEDLKNKIAVNLTTIESYKEKITNIPDDLYERLDAKENDIDNRKIMFNTDYENASASVTTTLTEIRLLQKQLQDIEEIGAVCTSCNRPYSEEDQKHKDSAKKNINKQLTKLNKDLDKNKDVVKGFLEQKTDLENESADILKKRNAVNSILQTNTGLQSKIDFIKDNNFTLNESVISAQKETNTLLEEAVRDIKIELDVYTDELDTINKNLNVLDSVKFVVSEEGVKAYIVKKVLKLLNTQLKYYLNRLQTNCICEFNEYFDEVIYDEKGELKSYFNFSGGERKRIDLACLFAFLDVRRMQGDINFTTVFYDELLDSSLDDKGVQLVVHLLRERFNKNNESCFIVTHRGSAILTKVDRTINLEKRNGFTYIAS